MPRISEAEIDHIKSSTDLLALIRSRGIELHKHGSKDWIGKCPFHNDCDSPNLIVSPAKGLYHCMACGAAGTSIQFVEKFDGVSFRHAYELLAQGGRAAFERGPARKVKQATVPKLPCPLDFDAQVWDDGTADERQRMQALLLQQAIDYYHKQLRQSRQALDYLAKRGLDDEELIKRFQIGFADRTLGFRLPDKNRKEGAELRSRLQELGLFRKQTGHEHFNGSIVVPVFDEQGNVSEVYGRKITRGLRKGTPNHLYLPGAHRGIFNADALKSQELILCESIIDALTFIRHGMDNVTCIYGTQGFTDELFNAIKAANLDSVRFAYDNDESGNQAAKRDAERLQAIGVSTYRINFPLGEDANSYSVNQGGEALKKAVRAAEFTSSGLPSKHSAAENSPSKSEIPNTRTDSSSLLVAKLAADEASPVAEGSQGKPTNATKKEKASKAELVPVGEQHELTLGDRRYRLGGLLKNQGLESLKMTLRLWNNDHFHLDQIDLCKDTDRRRFCERAAHECRLEPELISRDLGKLLLACEQEQDARLRSETSPDLEAQVTLTTEERSEAETLLKSPNLIEKLGASFDQAGIVGEQTNKLAAYLAATSRLLSKPLAVIIQSTSAAGKSTLMEAVLSFFPPESQIKYSAMTGQSLYYLGETNLQHKILAIVEEEGAEKASYALKLLQSEGELTIASTGKDATTGRMETQTYHVEGPVAIVLTTTSIDIDEELMNRCLILTVDESREQTERIHELQRKARTLEGLRLKKKRAHILTLLQNAQRLLRPLEVVNSYADKLTFTAERTRTRRDHEKYLTLIEAVTLLHQYQRPIEQDDLAGEHIKTTLQDIEIANQLAPEVLGRSLDELPPQTRRLLDAIKALVTKLCKTKVIDQDKCYFTRRQVREHTGQSETQVRLHLQRLEDLEYIQRRHGRYGVANVYELMIDCQEQGSKTHVGLLDLQKLKIA